MDNIDWIPVLLPRNIKFIISVTESTSIMSTIQEKLRDTAVFVEVGIINRNSYTNYVYLSYAIIQMKFSDSAIERHRFGNSIIHVDRRVRRYTFFRTA